MRKLHLFFLPTLSAKMPLYVVVFSMNFRISILPVADWNCKLTKHIKVFVLKAYMLSLMA